MYTCMQCVSGPCSDVYTCSVLNVPASHHYGKVHVHKAVLPSPRCDLSDGNEVGTLTLVMHRMTPPYLREIWGGDPNDITPSLREVRKLVFLHICALL